ncbi:penicillin-insensitive murein endopeptidase [Streptomyces xylophagus]|uniref:penicillin-insensitive murein endopeptidase n=1 Tax=Streptomyces xylophagus TaxID=285514 RepID=UPI000AEB9845|nr:penicillin-insensitive murein endopeptidase [Streptomyces xylophagus]
MPTTPTARRNGTGLTPVARTGRVGTTTARNRAYARSLGWEAHLPAVRRALTRHRRDWDWAALGTETLKWQTAHGVSPADGIVGPATWALLRTAAGVARDPAIAYQLPEHGLGVRATGRPAYRFGRPETARALLAVGAAWHRAHPQGPVLDIRDIGRNGGGPLPGHVSHRLGLDVDIRPVKADRRPGPTTWRHPSYSRALTQELVDLLRSNGVLPVHAIFFNDPEVRGVRPLKNHDDHLHVRFAPPPPSPPAASAAARRSSGPVLEVPGGTTPRKGRGELRDQPPPARGVVAVLPAERFGVLSAQGKAPYRFTDEDVEWTARFVIGESGGRDDADSHAVIWAMFNRYALLTRPYYRTFNAFLRAYSTPLQPVLKSWGASRRNMDRPDFVRTGGTFGPPAPPGIPRGQRRAYLDLQKRPWAQLPAAARSVAVRALGGAIPNPVGNATEFGSTYVYFHDANRRYPNPDEWRRFTEQYAAGMGWQWIGPVAGLNQNKNTFFVQRRLASLPVPAVRVLAG